MRAPYVIGFVVVMLTITCGGPATHQVTLINKTPRTIAEVYLFAVGASHGASRGMLAPNASLVVKVRGGTVEVLAVAEKERVNQTESETKQASSTIQLVRPVELIFHDSDQPGAIERNKMDQIGVTFRVTTEPAGVEAP